MGCRVQNKFMKGCALQLSDAPTHLQPPSWSPAFCCAIIGSRIISGLYEHAVLHLCDLWPLLGNLSWGWVQEKLFPATGVSISPCTSLWTVSLARDPFCYNCHWILGPKYNWIILFLTLFKQYSSNLCLCRTLCWAGRRHMPRSCSLGTVWFSLRGAVVAAGRNFYGFWGERLLLG